MLRTLASFWTWTVLGLLLLFMVPLLALTIGVTWPFDRERYWAGRIFGEAAALIFTAGLATPTAYDFSNFNLADPASPWSPFHPATTMAVYIWKINSEGLGDYVRQIADTTSAVLVLSVLFFNLGARGLGRTLQKRITGA